MNRLRQTGLLLVGHGTRSQQGRGEFDDLLAEIMRKLSGIPVEGCFLELAEPDIATGMHRLARRGARYVVVVPLLLFDAGHVQRDIPREVRKSAQQWGLRPFFAPALGCHRQIVELSAQRFHDAIDPHRFTLGDAFWILVARGNRDPEAGRQFHDFLAQRQQDDPVGDTRGAFLAIAAPHIESAIEDATSSPLKWVILQPHLLLAGELLTQLQRRVSGLNDAGGRQTWIMTSHLGSAPQVAAAVVDRFQHAIATAAFNRSTQAPPPAN